MWDLPGQLDFTNGGFDTESIYGPAGAMVWVLDASDDYIDSITRLADTILTLQQSYPDIKYAVFIHKVDSLSSDFTDDTVRDIEQRIMDDLNDAGLENPAVSFYATSVYDESVYEALSKVVQMLNPQLPTFENMLNRISNAGRFQKVYLFDVMTKLYVASDTSPIDMASYSLCADYIDTIVDLSEIYGWNRDRVRGAAAPPSEESQQSQEVEGAGESGSLASPPEPIQEVSAESFISQVGGSCLYLKEMNKCDDRWPPVS